jgi:hypothetical protein
MPQRPLEVDVKAQLECSLRLTLEYLIAHAHLRELFTIQEILARHAAEASWQQSQQGLGPIPHDAPAMPSALAQQLAEMDRHNERLRSMQEQANFTSAPYRQEG